MEKLLARILRAGKSVRVRDRRVGWLAYLDDSAVAESREDMEEL